MSNNYWMMGGVAVLIIFLLVVAVAFTLPYFRKAKLPPPSQTAAETKPSETLTTTETGLETPSSELQTALSKTRNQFFGRISQLFQGTGAQSELWEQLEESLYLSDVGSKTVQRLLNATQEHFSRFNPPKDENVVRDVLRDEMRKIFTESQHASAATSSRPQVWLVVGVNGVGKTTTIGKLAAQWAEEGKKVLVAAGDTFRAAAQSQLRVWTERAQVEIFEAPQTKDPAAVAYSALEKAKAQNVDYLIVDTAGRLHTAQGLMEELKKIKKVLSKLDPSAPQETILVLDASQGQNALVQSRQFHEALSLTGIILTKMDGTAKGGVAVGVAEELKIPIKYIGVGEKVRDLRPFEYTEFVDAII